MKLGLGTVQLGMEYGVANKTGKPDTANALEIIRTAIDNGIDSFDTASAYGDSEEILGEAVKRWDLAGKIKLCSKFTSLKTMDNQLEQSLKRLGTGYLDYYLLHGTAEVFENGAGLNSAFRRLKTEGLVKKCGVSIYSVSELYECLKYDEVEALQVPFNILDVRLAGVLQEVRRRGIEIHVRSVYLQGLLLLRNAAVPEKLGGALPFLNALDELAEFCGLSRMELAFLYVRDCAAVDKIFIGCETKAQLLQNLEFNRLPGLKMDISARVRELFSGVPERILNPALW